MFVRFEVISVVNMGITVFWDVMCNPKEIYCNGPLPFNGQLNADIVTATTVMHCDWVEVFQR
jgi:hypothetical protein